MIETSEDSPSAIASDIPTIARDFIASRIRLEGCQPGLPIELADELPHLASVSFLAVSPIFSIYVDEATLAKFPSVEELFKLMEICRKYAGRINGARMPMYLHLVLLHEGEVGLSAVQYLRSAYRSGLFAGGVHILPMMLDVRSSESQLIKKTSTAKAGQLAKQWANFSRGTHHQLEDDYIPDLSKKPILTHSIIAILCLAFSAQVGLDQIYNNGKSLFASILDPSVEVTHALGANTGSELFSGFHWYQLACSTLVHGGLIHLALNSFTFWMIGRLLEPLLGRVHFILCYLIAGLSGALASHFFYGAHLNGVGASGAILGLVGAGFIWSSRLPPGPRRQQLQVGLGQMLALSMLPIIGSIGGAQIDFAAHGGGALAGGLLAYLLIKGQPRTQEVAIRFSVYAALAALIPFYLASLGAMAYAAPEALSTWTRYSESALLPNHSLDSFHQASPEEPRQYLKTYPLDPRVRQRYLSFLFSEENQEQSGNKLREGVHHLIIMLQTAEAFASYFPNSNMMAEYETMLKSLLEADVISSSKETPICLPIDSVASKRLEAELTCPPNDPRNEEFSPSRLPEQSH